MDPDDNLFRVLRDMGLRTGLSADGTAYVVAFDLAQSLGARNANDITKALPSNASEYKGQEVIDVGNGERRKVNVLYKRGVLHILSGSRKIESIEILERLDLYPVRRYIKEADTLYGVRKALGHLDPKTQFTVGPYRVDLYFPTLGVAVECDENGHRDRDPDYETDRQRFIEDALGCTFVRYNPDDPDFNVFELINRVLTARP